MDSIERFFEWMFRFHLCAPHQFTLHITGFYECVSSSVSWLACLSMDVLLNSHVILSLFSIFKFVVHWISHILDERNPMIERTNERPKERNDCSFWNKFCAMLSEQSNTFTETSFLTAVSRFVSFRIVTLAH